MDQHTEELLKNIVRVGNVSSVNTANNTARVSFPVLDNMVSGDLRILQHCGSAVEVIASTSTPVHNHKATVSSWVPAIGQTVLCLYIPLEDGDGFILGGV